MSDVSPEAMTVAQLIDRAVRSGKGWAMSANGQGVWFKEGDGDWLNVPLSIPENVTLADRTLSARSSPPDGGDPNHEIEGATGTTSIPQDG